ASPWGIAGDAARGALVGAYVVVQALGLAYCSHRYLTLWRWWRGRSRPQGPAPPAPSASDEWPRVTVQLPVYNGRALVERLLDAEAALDYPRARPETQGLDDSTDETHPRAERAAARHRARGIDLRVLHRERREGYKAGALAFGLARARGE